LLPASHVSSPGTLSSKSLSSFLKQFFWLSYVVDIAQTSEFSYLRGAQLEWPRTMRAERTNSWKLERRFCGSPLAGEVCVTMPFEFIASVLYCRES
jgi:hypothetical protein